MPEFPEPNDLWIDDDPYESRLEEMINSVDDDLCTECDGDGVVNGHMCKSCQGSGRK